jgi:hypothetical protein
MRRGSWPAFRLWWLGQRLKEAYTGDGKVERLVFRDRPFLSMLERTPQPPALATADSLFGVLGFRRVE